MSTPLSRARDAAVQRQNGLCYYCDAPFIQQLINRDLLVAIGFHSKLAKHLQPTAEHLLPRCCGGGSGKSNIVAACLFCNRTRHRIKKAPSPEKYRTYVQKRIAADRWHPRELLLAARRLHFYAAKEALTRTSTVVEIGKLSLHCTHERAWTPHTLEK